VASANELHHPSFVAMQLALQARSSFVGKTPVQHFPMVDPGRALIGPEGSHGAGSDVPDEFGDILLSFSAIDRSVASHTCRRDR